MSRLKNIERESDSVELSYMWALIDLDILKIVLAPLKVLHVTIGIKSRKNTHKSGEIVQKKNDTKD